LGAGAQSKASDSPSGSGGDDNSDGNDEGGGIV
jgi:hypothetical protein